MNEKCMKTAKNIAWLHFDETSQYRGSSAAAGSCIITVTWTKYKPHIVSRCLNACVHPGRGTRTTESPPALHQSPVVADTAGAAVAGNAGSVGSAAAVVVDSAVGG